MKTTSKKAGAATSKTPKNHRKAGSIEAKLFTKDISMEALLKGKRGAVGGPVLQSHSIVIKNMETGGYNFQVASVMYQGIDIWPVLNFNLPDNHFFSYIRNYLHDVIVPAFDFLPLSELQDFSFSSRNVDQTWPIKFSNITYPVTVIATFYEASANGVYCTYPVFHGIMIDGVPELEEGETGYNGFWNIKGELDSLCCAEEGQITDSLIEKELKSHYATAIATKGCVKGAIMLTSRK